MMISRSLVQERADVFAMRSYELGPLAALYPGLIGNWSTRELQEAHRFLFAAHGDVPENFLRFGSDLVQRGLFRLPFIHTIMEFHTSAIDDPSLDRVVFLCDQVDMGGLEELKREDDPPIVILLWPLLRLRDGHWHAPQAEPPSDPPYIIVCAGQEAASSTSQARWSPFYADDKNKFWRHVGSMTLAIVPAAIAMMMSRSVTVAKVDVPPKLAAARHRGGKPALFQFHVVEVPTRESRKHAKGVSLAGLPRASPMLHWRRGHYRRLPTERLIPVAPCLVGSQEHGIIAKVYDGKNAHDG